MEEIEEKIKKLAWHSMEGEEVLKELKSSKEGLTNEETKRRLAEYGPNELKKVKKRGLLKMFLDEFKDVFVLLLIVATIFSAFIGYYESRREPGKSFLETYTDSITILIIIF